MSYYNPQGHGGAPPSPCPSPSPPPPPPQGYTMDPYAERGMEELHHHHCHQQYGPPPPQPMYASPYGQPPPAMYQQPYGQPVYASPYGQPPPAMYPPPYAQPPPPPPPPRKTGASFAEGWFCRNLLLLPHGRMLLIVWSTSSGRSKRRLSTRCPSARRSTIALGSWHRLHLCAG
ncbi:early nodulin-75-like isoform X1 [Miscanthus floridulus]|uniref:early nodulin-75-like isoform X1 n=1 Tax=Miscanthus floridulus TaxID=154761 RepID=UPI0034589320